MPYRVVIEEEEDGVPTLRPMPEVLPRLKGKKAPWVFKRKHDAYAAMVDYVVLHLGYLPDEVIVDRKGNKKIKAYVYIGEGIRAAIVKADTPLSNGKKVYRQRFKNSLNPGTDYHVSYATKIDGSRVVITFVHQGNVDAENTWTVALVIGATRRVKRQVRQTGTYPMETPITGRIGLKGLVWAAKQIDRFQEEHPEAEVAVGWADDRREKAYQWLCRRGFTPAVYDGEPVLFRSAYQAELHRK